MKDWKQSTQQRVMSRNLIKILLSLAIIYHLLAVIVFPNPNSILARSLAPLINPYGNTLGLNTTWQFFSPDPGHLRYVSYQVVVETGEDFQLEDFSWPPDNTEGMFTANIGRRFYHAFRTVLTDDKRQNYLVPFLCRKHPQATSIVIKTVNKVIPSIEEMQLESYSKFSDVQKTLPVPSQEYGCERENHG